VVSNTKILAALPPEERGIGWPKYSENWLTPIFENEIAVRGAEVVTYLPKKGDVLFWHGRLVHRGSEPNVPGMLRKSMIAHFTGINHRQDMPTAVRYTANGCDGYYFPINGGSLVPTPK
jgi:ectoine hydroxylase-related dioxygenase (phytanoyl-CoA dioxygenase family)